MGSDANSDIIMVIANSKGSNSPICFLPISLIDNITKRYKIIVLIKTINICKPPYNHIVANLNKNMNKYR